MEKNRFVKRKLIQVCVVALFVTIVLWLFTEESADNHPSTPVQPVLEVSTLGVKPSMYTVKESVVGVTKARWPMDLVSAVEGRVLELDETTEIGKAITANTLLVAIDDTTYKANLTSAEAQVKQAQLELARFQHEQTVTNQVSAGKKTSAFGRFEPHIEAAMAKLEAAKDFEAQAQQRLRETRLYPPFDAIVLERNVVPGQWVNTGEKLFTLIASDSIDVHMELSPQQIQSLGVLNANTSIYVTDQFGHKWDAQLRYEIPSHSLQTKQLQLVAYINQPYEGNHTLLPNSMVTVTIVGKEINNVVCAPATVLTPDGYVWVVEDARLNKSDIQILEQFEKRVCFQFSQQPSAKREIVRYPVSTMLIGQRVATLPEEYQGSAL